MKEWKKEEERHSKAEKNMGLSHEMLCLMAQRSAGDDGPQDGKQVSSTSGHHLE